MPISNSYLLRLRKIVGSQVLLAPGGRAILEDEQQRVLLMKRSDLGLWDLPGGSADEGESAEGCVVREVYEETGLRVEQFEVVGFASAPELETVRYPNGDIIQGFSLILYVTQWSGVVRNSEESTAIQFFDRRELPAMRPNIRLTLDKFGVYRESGKFQLF
jgi:8-oxo-dGTP pyrophosphatase MutT (NUDIX family)